MLTTSERRGLSLLVLVFALGALRDLWTWHRLGEPGVASAPPASAVGVAGAWEGDAATEGGAVPRAPAVADPAPAVPLDLNRANAAELDGLPGIGPVLAGRILEHRERHGPFREPDDLLAVPGIGPRLLERLRSRIRTVVPDSLSRRGATTSAR